jgi:hypothetical protein
MVDWIAHSLRDERRANGGGAMVGLTPIPLSREGAKKSPRRRVCAAGWRVLLRSLRYGAEHIGTRGSRQRGDNGCGCSD